jgi:perosamine synthetase
MQNLKKNNKFITRINININFHAIKIIFFSFFKKKNYKQKFEKKFTDYVGSKNILFTGSGRSSLFLILRQISKITNKKEILISPFTLTEVINVIKYAGFVSKFIDIDIHSGLPKFLDKHISKNTCAILVTHLFTSDKKFKIFKKKVGNKLFIIEDAAINLGGKINGKSFFGTFSDYGFFSFGAAKNLCLISGGAAYFKRNSDLEAAKKIYKNFLNYPSLDFFCKFIKVIALKIFVSHYFLNLFSFKIIKSMYEKKNFFFKIFYPGLHPVFRNDIPSYCTYKISRHCFEAGVYQIAREKKNILFRQEKAMYYFSKLKKISKDKIYLFYQNKKTENCFIEYPIFLKNYNAQNLHNEFLRSNIDLRFKWYIDNSIFNELNPKNLTYINSSLCEKKILCFPTHSEIRKFDIDYILEKFIKLIEK